MSPTKSGGQFVVLFLIYGPEKTFQPLPASSLNAALQQARIFKGLDGRP